MPTSAAEQEADRECRQGDRVRSFLDDVANVVVGFANRAAGHIDRIVRHIFGLTVHLLRGAFGLIKLSLGFLCEIAAYGAVGFLHLAAKVCGGACNPVVCHWDVLWCGYPLN